jgi:Holliday junction resolvase RusA-like endonuclease
VVAAARTAWGKSLLFGKVKVTIINFHSGTRPSVDVDNMSKPIHDVMNRVVYGDDRQIRQAAITHLRIDEPMIVNGVSKILVDAVRIGSQFVYVRVEDAVEPFPLPKERQ